MLSEQIHLFLAPQGSGAVATALMKHPFRTELLQWTRHRVKGGAEQRGVISTKVEKKNHEIKKEELSVHKGKLTASLKS